MRGSRRLVRDPESGDRFSNKITHELKNLDHDLIQSEQIMV
jgi:hypothetical protein